MLFIGEIGINHNGSLDVALELIRKAKECGVDVVKFQKRNPDVCVPEDQKLKPRKFGGKDMTYIEYKHLLEFGKSEYDAINAFCKDIGIKWTASVWDVDSVHFMSAYKDDIPFIKIPSACITDMELLDAVNSMGVPVIVSNGMSTQEEVDRAVTRLASLMGILHCNSSYPAKEDELDLNVITSYKHKYDTLVGYSGHEAGLLPTIVAASIGADIIERHITLDKNMEGTDHKASLDINELERLVELISRVLIIKGRPYSSV